jgi:hypothetical protein
MNLIRKEINEYMHKDMLYLFINKKKHKIKPKSFSNLKP